MPPREGTYGLLAEFDTPSDLVRAARQAYHDGWRRMDCYTPYPVEEAAEAIGFHRNKVPLVTLVGGLMGLTAMFLARDLDLGDRLSAQHRGAAAVFLAGVHRARLRVDHPVGGAVGGLRHGGAEPHAGALSSPVQCAQLPQRRHHGQVLSVPGSAGSEVRPVGNARSISKTLEPVSVVEVEY